MFFGTLWVRIGRGKERLKAGFFSIGGLAAGLVSIACALTGLFSPVGVIIILGVLSGLIRYEESGMGMHRNTERDGFVFALGVIAMGFLMLTVTVGALYLAVHLEDTRLPRYFRIL